MILNSGSGVAIEPSKGLSVDTVYRINGATALFDPLCPMVYHVEVFKVKETASLARDEHHRTAGMTVHLKFHIAAKIAAVVLKITNFHN